jgi:hypothetical protein
MNFKIKLARLGKDCSLNFPIGKYADAEILPAWLGVNNVSLRDTLFSLSKKAKLGIKKVRILY